MGQTKGTGAAEYIVSLNINGLKGRMLRMPAPKNHNREVLVVYGHHAKLERWWGLVQNLQAFGAVTMPDLPGFGGMDSFYKIGRKPTLDNFAEYLATFCQLRYKRRRVTIVGVSFGFVVATRMLQLYPDIAKKVDLLVSAAGFAHSSDFTFSKRRILAYRAGSRLLSLPIISTLFRWTALSPWVLRRAYARTHNAKHKFSEAAGLPEQFEQIMETEIELWHINHVRTHFVTTNEFLRLDNCKKRVDLPVWHTYPKKDAYFNPVMVEQHLRLIFSDYHQAPMAAQKHVISVLADKKEAAAFIPPKLRRLLSKKAL